MIRRRWWAGAAVTGAGLVLGATTVFACTSLSTLNLSQAAGAPGTNINITGSSFGSTAQGNSAVTLHWNSADGMVLATNIVPDASGSIGPVSVTVPGGAAASGVMGGAGSTASVAPGYYAIVATQTASGGTPVFGTPARAAFQVMGTAPVSSGQIAAGPTAAALSASTSGLGTGVIVLLAVLGVAGLLLFGVGAATVLGTSRRTAVSRVRKP